MFEAYKVAVRLSLVSNVGAGLAVLSTQFAKLNKDATGVQNSINGLQKSLLEIKRLGMVGGAMAGVGFGALSLFRAPLEAAKEYDMAAARFKTLNLGDAMNKEADKFARGTQAFGASSTQLMDTLRESIGMFGDFKNAASVAPLLAELNAANSAMFGGKYGQIDEGAVRAIMRFNDMRGKTNTPEEFRQGLDLAQRLVTGSGGAIKFGDLETLAKRGGTAFKGLSDEGVMMLATVMQEQGGSATGTALMSFYQNLIAGRTTALAMSHIQQGGLGTVGRVLSGTINGKPSYKTRVTSIIDEELLRTNPGAWLIKYVEPAARKAGAKTDSEVAKFVNDLVSNRTGSNMAATFTTQSLQAMRDLKLVRGAMGAQQTVDEFKKTQGGNIAELQAEWNRTLTELGSSILPIAIQATKGLISVLKPIAEFANNHKDATGIIMGMVGGLSALVAAGGVVLMATAAFKALGLAMAFNSIGGIGAVVTGFKALGGVFFTLLKNPVVMAAIAGWGAGTLINENLSQDTKDNIGRGIAKTLAFFGNDDAKAAVEAEDRYIRSQKGGKSGKQGDIYMDGRKVGEIVSGHQARAAQRPTGGTTTFDGRMAPQPVGATSKW